MIKNKILKTFPTLRSNRFCQYSILFLIGIDIAFILLHLSAELTASSVPDSIAITKDGSFPEIYQYLKYGVTSVILVYLSFKLRSAIYTAWALVFAYLFLDDSLAIHEQGGLLIANTFNINGLGSLRGQDFGELVVTASAAIFLATFVLIAYLKCQDERDRRNSNILTLSLILLAVCGIGFDMLQVAISSFYENISFLSNIFALLEDGGEMFISSFMLWIVIQMFVEEYDLSPQAME